MRKSNKDYTCQCTIPSCGREFIARYKAAKYCRECAFLVDRWRRKRYGKRQKNKWFVADACAGCGEPLPKTTLAGEIFCQDCLEKQIYAYVALTRAAIAPGKTSVAATPLPQKKRRDRSETPPSQRCCHDCGRPTSQYRCDSCWGKWRLKHGVTVEGVLA